MMNSIIERYKKIRKKGMLTKKYKGKYAFVGVGNHSINNLYPVLNYLNVDIKYIVVKNQDTLDLISQNFPNIIATTNLQEVLSDSEISGVFVSANPSAHFALAKDILKANKNLFIEKPPCTSLLELEQLIAAKKNSTAQLLTGLQRRYAPVYNILKNKLNNPNYYTLKHKTGAYPEGDELLDLFIHPLDAAFFLFGAGEIHHINVIKGKGVITYFAHIKHDNGVIGNLELSTNHSWIEALDHIEVNCKDGEFQVENSSKLIFKSKPKVIMGIPLEKIISYQPQTTVLYQQNNFLPVKEHNQLYTAGYFNELSTFLDLCENNKAVNNSPIDALQATFKAIEKLRKAKG